ASGGRPLRLGAAPLRPRRGAAPRRRHARARRLRSRRSLLPGQPVPRDPAPQLLEPARGPDRRGDGAAGRLRRSPLARISAQAGRSDMAGGFAMNRIVCSLLAAGAAALALASPAGAHPLPEEAPCGRSEYRWERLSWREWRELRRARHRFYASWDGNP